MARLASRSADEAYGRASAGPSVFLAATPLEVAPTGEAPSTAPVQALADAEQGQLIVAPAVLGTSFESRCAAGEALSAAGVNVGELAGTSDAVLGRGPASGANQEKWDAAFSTSMRLNCGLADTWVTWRFPVSATSLGFCRLAARRLAGHQQSARCASTSPSIRFEID
jgi:hypothetical protein